MAAPVVNNTGTPASQTTGNQLTFSYTSVSGGGDLFVVGGCGSGVIGQRTPSSIKFNGVDLSVVIEADDANFERSGIWRLAEASVPIGTFNVVITTANNAQFGWCAFQVSGVTGIGATATNATTSGASVSTSSSLSPTADDIVIAGIASDSETGIAAVGTAIYEVENVASDSSFGAERYAGGGSVTPSYNLSQSVGGAICAVIVQGSAGGGSTSGGLFTMTMMGVQ